MEAELHFVDGLIKEIAAGDLEGLEMWRTFHTEGTIPLEGMNFNFEPK